MSNTPHESVMAKYATGNSGDKDRQHNTVPEPVPAAPGHRERGNLIVVEGTISSMLGFRLPGGKRKAFPYSYLSSVELDPQRGLVCSFPETAVTITGRNLAAIYTAITNQTALAVVQSPSGFDPGNDEPFVETILIAGVKDVKVGNA